MTPFFKSKFFKFCAFLLALLAVSTPFWLFNSTQSIIDNSNQSTSPLNQSTISTTPDSKTTGTIELNALPKDQAQSEANSKAKAHNSNKDSQSKPEPKASLGPNSSQDTAPKSTDPKLSAAQGPAPAQGKEQAQEQSQDPNKAQKQGLTAAAAHHNTPSAQETSGATGTLSPKDSDERTADKNKDPKLSQNQDKGQKSDQGDGQSQSKSDGQGQDKNLALKSEQLKDKVAMKGKDEQPTKTNSNVLTDSVEQSSLTEQIIATKDELKKQEKQMTLAQKVKALTDAQTSEQKAQYQRSIEERQEMVDAAIASIAENSKMYLPPIISSQALVVTFSVPIDKASLSDGQDHGVDATTGATLIKYENSVESPMSFIAQRLNKESGADLYYITPATLYPKKQNKLYQFALSELTEKNYPELTDDVPLHLERYDTIYLCYPIWWDDLPAAVYSFLIKYDLSDKTIIPVCLHSGDEFANTINTIITYEPHAIVYKKGLSISTKESLNSNYINNKIRTFLSNLAADFN